MNQSIPISAKMTTYGRVSFLEEALYSFLNQDYEGDSELVIVNDYPLQKLHFDHPKVRIINLDKTFPVIGEKENFAIEQCKYDNIYNCDDDDVFLKHHFQNINQFFPGNDLLHWNMGIFMVSHKIKKIGALGNCGIVYNRAFVRELGGYPKQHTGAVTFKLVDNGACGTETIFYGLGEPTTTETPTTTAVPTTTEEPTTTGLLPVTLALFNNSGYVHITGVIVGGETLFSGDLAPMSSTGTSFEIDSAQEELSLQVSYTDGGVPSSIVVNDKLGTQCHTTLMFENGITKTFRRSS